MTTMKMVVMEITRMMMVVLMMMTMMVAMAVDMDLLQDRMDRLESRMHCIRLRLPVENAVIERNKVATTRLPHRSGQSG